LFLKTIIHHLFKMAVAAASQGMSLSGVMSTVKDKATFLSRGHLPASWTAFVGSTGELVPFNVTPHETLAPRIVANSRTYGYNYLIIALAAGFLRVILSPSLLFLTGAVVAGWSVYLNRSYEALRIPQVYYLRAVATFTFGVLCLVGPAALSWSFGVGGSVAVAHASLRNGTEAHKNDDVRSEEDDDLALMATEAGRSETNGHVLAKHPEGTAVGGERGEGKVEAGDVAGEGLVEGGARVDDDLEALLQQQREKDATEVTAGGEAKKE